MRRNDKLINKTLIKRVIVVLLAGVICISITSCSSYNNFKRAFIDNKTEKSANTIYIGVYEPQTGNNAKNGNDEIKGIELANRLYNNVKGKNIELVKVDAQSDPATARTAIKDIIDMDPIAIIGGAGENESMIAVPYIEKAKIPTLTPSATNPLITEGNDYYFRVCITGSQIGSGLAEYAYKKVGARTPGMIRIKGDSVSGVIGKGFRDKFKDLSGGGSRMHVDEMIGIDDSDFDDVIKRIKKTKTDVVYLPFGAEKADAFFRHIEKADLTDITFLGIYDWAGNDFVNMMKKHPKIRVVFPSDTVFNTEGIATSGTTPETQKFLIEYSNMYGADQKPTNNAALGYDAYLLIANAINRAPTFSRKDIRDAIASTSDYRCATGLFTFDENGNPLRPANISTIRNNKVVSLYLTKERHAAENLQKIKEEKKERD